jgi:hypothetical protein
MTRRGLIGALIGAATMDPERLLWVPGRRGISIPKPVPIAESGIFIVQRRWYVDQIMRTLQTQLEVNQANADTENYRCDWKIGDTVITRKPARFVG